MSVHIIGGGVAGLAAAIGCIKRGRTVTLYEAAPQLGGRCRSYHHDAFNCDLDNGAHAVLSNNTAVHEYLSTTGATDRLRTFGCGGLPFVDLRDHANWTLTFPQALWDTTARPPGTSVWDLLCGVRLFWNSRGKTGRESLNTSTAAIEKLWEPMCTSALNTPLAEADANLLAIVVRGMAGVSGLRAGLRLPKQSLNDTYITPAHKWLLSRGATIHLQSPLRDVAKSKNRIERLIFAQADVPINTTDSTIFAVPPWAPIWEHLGLRFDVLEFSPILNVHFKIPPAPTPSFIGLIGGLSQWLWVHDDVATLTVSAAQAHMNTDSDALAKTIWSEIAPVLNQPASPLPPSHVVKERRATLRHIVGGNALRPAAQTAFSNLILAGDWVDTGLPCTLESAMQAGFAAARLA